MAAQENTEGTVSDTGHGLIPTSCIHLNNAISTIDEIQPNVLYGSGEEVIPKARKPYTITKQRERWTEEEHRKFLDALKLHGRAWRRIEEHIGTKTAVQIRSHAQKFFSKVTRESSCNSSTMNSIEIPPPRPKRKPIHPYPRKSDNSSIKGMPASLQPQTPLFPTQTVFDGADHSPKSVLPAVSDMTRFTFLNPSNGSSSPVSSATGSPSPVTSSADKEWRTTSPLLASSGSSLLDRTSLELENDYKDCGVTKDASSVGTPPVSLKLFGRTLLVNASHRTSSPLVLQHQELSVLTDSKTQQRNSEGNVRKQDETPRTGSFKNGWNPRPLGASPVYHSVALEKEGSVSTEASPPIPWWAVDGSSLFHPICSENTHPKQNPSHPFADSSDNVELVNKDDSWTGSSGDASSFDGNCEVVDSKSSVEVKAPVAVLCLKAGERGLASLRIQSAGDFDKEPASFFQLRASEDSASAFSQATSLDCRKGFVPYKRCLTTERDVKPPLAGGDERQSQRIRLCL